MLRMNFPGLVFEQPTLVGLVKQHIPEHLGCVRPISEVIDIVTIVYFALANVEIVTSLTELTLMDSSLATAAKRCHQVFVYY